MTQTEQLGLLVSDSSSGTSSLPDALRQNAASLDAAMQRVFAPTEETRQDKARHMMGALLVGVADEQLEVYLTELDYLVNSWLDKYERQVFGDQTLKELLG
jgi:hypothetical protein